VLYSDGKERVNDFQACLFTAHLPKGPMDGIGGTYPLKHLSLVFVASLLLLVSML
jgi:hypothetical protein